MSCNIYISQCLPEDDSPDAEVERLVHLGLKIVATPVMTGVADRVVV